MATGVPAGDPFDPSAPDGAAQEVTNWAGVNGVEAQKVTNWAGVAGQDGGGHEREDESAWMWLRPYRAAGRPA